MPSLWPELWICYLWIDALCILQDDGQDWERQSAQMQMIYANAALTIVAASTWSVAQSFLSRPTFRTRISLHSACDGQQLGNLYAYYLASQLHFNMIHMPTQDGPWATRAWTLQEQCLATRTLSFTERVFYIGCLETIAVEPGMTTEWSNYIPHSFRPWADREHIVASGRSFVESNQESTQDRLHRLYTLWLHTVSRYTARNISLESDRSQAIEGLAMRMLAELGNDDEYIDGLFRGDVVSGIMWKVPVPVKTMLTRKIDSQIPSWSWLSYPGKVDRGPRFQSLVPMINNVWVSSASPMLVRMTGHVVLAAELIDITNKAGKFFETLVKRRCYRVGGADFVLDYAAMEQDMVDLAAILIGYVRNDGFPCKFTSVYGLLLQRIEDSNTGHSTYRRCGTFKIQDRWTNTVFGASFEIDTVLHNQLEPRGLILI